MEIKTKKIKAKSPKKNSNKSIDKYKDFLGDKKDIHKSKDKKVFHVTRKRVSPKKIKKRPYVSSPGAYSRLWPQ